jgi:hypothetical protein
MRPWKQWQRTQSKKAVAVGNVSRCTYLTTVKGFQVQSLGGITPLQTFWTPENVYETPDLIRSLSSCSEWMENDWRLTLVIPPSPLGKNPHALFCNPTATQLAVSYSTQDLDGGSTRNSFILNPHIIGTQSLDDNGLLYSTCFNRLSDYGRNFYPHTVNMLKPLVKLSIVSRTCLNILTPQDPPSTC